MTYLEKLRKALPDADVETITSTMCPGYFFKGAPKMFDTNCNDDCERCWNKEASENG